MAEEQVVEKPVAPNAPEIITPENAFSDNVWGRQPIKADPVKPEPAAPVKPDPEKPAATGDDEVVDELEYLEKQTGYKSWDDIKALKTEVEQLRAKPQTAPERKFANEESKKLAEAWEAGETDKVFDYLNTQRQLKKAADLPAADAIKLHLQQTNPHFKPEDVEDVFEERYSIPKKPVQMAGEEPEQFEERVQEYNTRVAKVNRAIERDGVSAKADLAKRITELVPPEIPKAEPKQQGPDPKVLERQGLLRDAYVKKLESDYNGFSAYNTKVKDELVELPISFKVDDKDKAEIKQLVNDAVFKNLDVNEYFGNRWFTPDANGVLIPDIQKMMSDFMLLEKTEKILQGTANESAAQRLKHQMKIQSNIKVDGSGKVVVEAGKDEQTKMLDHFWKNT